MNHGLRRSEATTGGDALGTPAKTGQECPESRGWVVAGAVSTTEPIVKGDTVPPHGGQAVTWRLTQSNHTERRSLTNELPTAWPRPQRTHELVTDDQLEQYRADDFCVLSEILPDVLLTVLLEECDQTIGNVHAEMDKRSVDVLYGSRRGRQYIPGTVELRSRDCASSCSAT